MRATGDRFRELRATVEAAIVERDKPIVAPEPVYEDAPYRWEADTVEEVVREPAFEPVFRWPGAGRLATR
jgi:hypothetical protein